MARIHRQQPTENGENGHANNKHSEGNGTEKKEYINNVNGTATINPNRFVERVSSIPLFKDGVSTAQALANKTSLGRFALSKANSTYTTVTSYASSNQAIQTHYQNYAQPLVQRADAFGCRSLDIIQEKVPLINQLSSEIYQNVVAKPSYQIIDGVKVRLDSTLSTVTHPAHVVIQETNKRLGLVANNLEGAVDRYLPADTEGTANNKRESNVSSTDNGNQVVRVYGVLNEASRRITQKVSQQVSKSTASIPKSRGDLSKMAENNSVIQSITGQLRLLQETLVQSVTVYGNVAQERLPPSVTARIHQTTELFTRVTNNVNQQLGHIVNYLKTQPDWVKQKFQGAIDSTYQQLAVIKQEFARKDIGYSDKFKHVASSLQNQILPVLEQISSHLAIYSEKAQQGLHTPLHYIGYNQKVKTQ